MIYSEDQRNNEGKFIFLKNSNRVNQSCIDNSKRSYNGVLNSLQITQSRITEGQVDKIFQLHLSNKDLKTTTCESCLIWEDWSLYFEQTILSMEQKMIEKQKRLQNKMKELNMQLQIQKELLKGKQTKYETQKIRDQQIIQQLKSMVNQFKNQITKYEKILQDKKILKNQDEFQINNKQFKIKANKTCKNFQTVENDDQESKINKNKVYKKLSCSIQQLPEQTARENSDTFYQYDSQPKVQLKNKQTSTQKVKINNLHNIRTHESIYNESIATSKYPLEQQKQLKEKQYKHDQIKGTLFLLQNEDKQSQIQDRLNLKTIITQSQQSNQLNDQKSKILSSQAQYNQSINKIRNKTQKKIQQSYLLSIPGQTTKQITSNVPNNRINLSYLKSQYQNENIQTNQNLIFSNLKTQVNPQQQYLFDRQTFISNKQSISPPPSSTLKKIKLNLNNCHLNVQKSRFNQTATDCSFVNDYSRGNGHYDHQSRQQTTTMLSNWEIGQQKEGIKNLRQIQNSQKNKKKLFEEMQKLKIQNQNLKSYNRVLLQKLSNSRPRKY